MSCFGYFEEEVPFDGKWVLTADTDMTAEEVAIQYKMLWMVETIFIAIRVNYPR